MLLLRKQGVKRLTVLPTFLFSVNVTGKSPNKRRTAMPEDNVKVEPLVEAPEPPKEPKQRQPKQPKKITVRPVYGRMVHMHTAQEINGDTEVAEIDSWLKAQIDAGKIVVVE